MKLTEFYAGKCDIAVIGAGHAGIEAALAAAHTHLVREAPNVAQTDCRTDSGHQETKVGAKRSAIVFHNFLSLKINAFAGIYFIC